MENKKNYNVVDEELEHKLDEIMQDMDLEEVDPAILCMKPGQP